MSQPRRAQWQRKSRETEISVQVNLDGTGRTAIATPIGFLNHMLELMAFHAFLDLDLRVHKADTEVDWHHTNEDIGIVLGKAISEALGERKGIRRFGSGWAPMEDVLGHCVIDISGRGYFHMTLNGQPPADQEGYSLVMFEHFMESLTQRMGATVHVRIFKPQQSNADLHTVLETGFKSFGLALAAACRLDERRGDTVPSTKGIID